MTFATITVAQMREVNRLMVEEYGIALLQIMENAGRNLAEVACRQMGGGVAGVRTLTLVGSGNNGGGGLAAARHLANAGADMHVALSAPPPLSGEVPERQRVALERMRIPDSDRVAQAEEIRAVLSAADLVLDALLGYGVCGAPHEPIASLIRAANATSARRLALDLPSGLDGDTGAPDDPTMRATATLTLAWPKVGLLSATARPYVGTSYPADISIPAAIYAAVGVQRGMLFAHGPIVQARLVEDGWEPEPLDASGAKPAGEET